MSTTTLDNGRQRCDLADEERSASCADAVRRFAVRITRYLALVLGLVLAACGGGGPTTAPSSGAPSVSAPASSTSAEPSGPPDLTGVTLELWTSTGMATPVQNVWRNFEKATGAKVEYIAIPDPWEDTLMAKWIVNDRPDLLAFHPDPINMGKLQPEENLVDLSGEEFVGRTKFGLYDYIGTLNSKQFAAFTTFPSVSGAFYNKDVFSRLSLQPPANWAELISMCQAIRSADPSITPVMGGGGAMWPVVFIAASYLSDAVKNGVEDEINADTAKFTDPRITGAFQSLLDMKDKGCFEDDLTTSVYEDQVARLAEGKAAVVIQGAFILADMTDSNGADVVQQKIGYFPVSADGKLAFWSVGQTGTYMVPKNEDPAKEAAALEFIRYATGEGHQLYVNESGELPVLEGIDPPATISPVWQQLNDDLEAGAVPFFGSSLKYPRGDLGSFLNELLTGAKTPEQVGEAMQEAWDTAKAAGG
jgi:raffinose/stachyose/melibiose transport system substrate-binding protein